MSEPLATFTTPPLNIMIGGPSETSANYSAALRAMGASSAAAVHTALHGLSSYDGLILPGGGDIDPSYFNQADCGSRDVDPLLDQAQFRLLHFFIQQKKPVLGICKGLQIINVYFGGNIIQHLPTAQIHSYHNGDRVHPVICRKDSFLYELYGRQFTVNSAHHQGIGLCGQDLLPVLHSPDGVTEALEHKTLPVTAVQWHPERMCFTHRREDAADGSLLLARFLRTVREYKKHNIINL